MLDWRERPDFELAMSAVGMCSDVCIWLLVAQVSDMII
jgi:hypothetical protein